MAGSNALVSIVVPAYNAEATISRSVDSILAQTYKNIEIVVVDDGSKDGTADVCRKYGDRIRYVRQDNLGPGAARNTGIGKAIGEFIGFLDADDWYLPEKIEQNLKVFSAFPEVGAVTSAFVQKSEFGEMVTPEPGRVFGGAATEGIIDYFLAESQGYWVVNTNTILIRKDVLDSVGSFNTNMFYGEDIDRWCRIAGQFDIAYQDKPLTVYDRTNEASLCHSVSVLDHGVDYLYGQREVAKYIAADKQASYVRFRNKILLARLMLSIYERNRRSLRACLRKIYPLPFNIRILLALAVYPMPLFAWPRNKRN